MYEYTRFYPMKIGKEEHDIIRITAQKYKIDIDMLQRILKRLARNLNVNDTSYLLSKIIYLLNKNLKIYNHNKSYNIKDFCKTYKFNYENLLYIIIRTYLIDENLNDNDLVKESLKNFYNSYQYGNNKYYYPDDDTVVTSYDLFKNNLINKENVYSLYSRLSIYNYSNADVLEIINDALNYELRLSNYKITLTDYSKDNKIPIKYPLYYIIRMRLDYGFSQEDCFKNMILNSHDLKNIYYDENKFKDINQNIKKSFY